MQPDVSETVDPVPPPPSIPEDGNAADDTWDSVVDEDPVEQTMSANASSTASRPRRKSQVTHDVQNLLQDAMQPLSFRANFVGLVKRYIDYVAGVMVLLNSLVLIAELEVEGRSIAFEIDLPSGEDLRAYLPALRGIDAVFVLVFLVELVFRLLFERLKFCLDRSWAWAWLCRSLQRNPGVYPRPKEALCSPSPLTGGLPTSLPNSSPKDSIPPGSRGRHHLEQQNEVAMNSAEPRLACRPEGPSEHL